MKPFMGFLVLLVVCFCCVACSSNNSAVDAKNTAEGSHPSESDDLSPLSPPQQQPIGFFDSAQDAIRFLATGQTQSEDAARQIEHLAKENVQALRDIFLQEGFLYEAICTEAESLPYITLFPEADLEDAGVAYWFKAGESRFQCWVRTVQKGEQRGDAETVEAYFQKRFPKLRTEILEYNGHMLTCNGIRNGDREDHVISAWIDETHYFSICNKTEMPLEDLLAFAQRVTFRKSLL